jgi:hypothetical protein
MKDVKNPLIISEYYPRILPPDGAQTAQPVTRLTPHFHNMDFENITATGAEMAGAIVGLPEAPVNNITLKNVKLSGQTGLSIGYATVTATNLTVNAEQGEGVIKMPGANLTQH